MATEIRMCNPSIFFKLHQKKIIGIGKHNKFVVCFFVFFKYFGGANLLCSLYLTVIPVFNIYVSFISSMEEQWSRFCQIIQCVLSAFFSCLTPNGCRQERCLNS